MRYLASFAAGAALAMLALASIPSAYAQSGASCPIGAPKTVAASSYTLTNNDECFALIFTSPNPVTVRAPAANTIAPGYQVLLVSLYNGLTVSSTVSTINNAPAQVLGAGQSALLTGDGSTYWWGAGAGFGMIPATFSGTMSQPVTTWSNSPVVMLPNGILQITSPSSIVRNAGDAFAVCKGGSKLPLGGPAEQMNQAQRGGPAWLQVLDALQRPYRIPLC